MRERCWFCNRPADVRFDAAVNDWCWFLCAQHALEILHDDAVLYSALYEALA